MRTLKIGIYDEEPDYVERLSSYLNREGAGKWSVAAYTEKNIIEKNADTFDLISGTDRQFLYRLKEQRKMPVLWLKENAGGGLAAPDIPCVCRYLGAKAIAGELEGIINTMFLEEKNRTCLVAVYSPVGRCGKTEYSLQLVKQSGYGRWLYIGMEDYSYMWEKSMGETAFSEADSFIYFVKEKNEEQLFNLVTRNQGIIPSAFSFADTKCLDEDDIFWILEWMQKLEAFDGVVFDLGTGVLPDITVLREFDYVVIPFIKQEKAGKKVEHFNAMIEAYGMEGIRDRLLYVNMESKEEKNRVLERISKGEWER